MNADEDTDISFKIPLDDAALAANCRLPHDAKGLVIFVHGSGSHRKSPRNTAVARTFHRRRLATLLFDLLTPAEAAIDAETSQFRFDVPFLAIRLLKVTQWVEAASFARALPLGYFGSSTGAAAALGAASEPSVHIRAVVSRGGRVDLALEALSAVRAPTLLIVGEMDEEVLHMNRSALHRLGGPAELVVVPGASHLFEEPQAMDAVALLAGNWFEKHLVR